jgi:hypothetical protein
VFHEKLYVVVVLSVFVSLTCVALHTLDFVIVFIVKSYFTSINAQVVVSPDIPVPIEEANTSFIKTMFATPHADQLYVLISLVVVLYHTHQNQ